MPSLSRAVLRRGLARCRVFTRPQHHTGRRQINKAETGLPENAGLKAGAFGVLDHEQRIAKAEAQFATKIALNWKVAYLSTWHGGTEKDAGVRVCPWFRVGVACACIVCVGGCNAKGKRPANGTTI